MKIAHLSDLHLGVHDDSIWEKVTEILRGESPDLFIITGDICDHSEKIQYQRFLDWLRGEISITDNTKFGLKLSDSYKKNVIIVPGNHDYFDSNKKRFVSNRTYFNEVFKHISLPYWRFIKDDNSSIFLVMIDSNEYVGGLNVANGSVSKKDLKYIKNISELARHGNLKNNDGHYLGCKIIKTEEDAKEEYKKSIKILVMHHYCILPNAEDESVFMEIKNREDVLARIASDDFDIILCGHQHLGSFDVRKYKNVMDKRAINRYIEAYLWRQVGDKEVVPIYDIDEKNKMIPWIERFAINLLKKICKKTDNVINVIYERRGIYFEQRVIKNCRRKFIKTKIYNKKTKRIISKLAKIIDQEIEQALQIRSLANSIPKSLLKKTEQNGLFIININNNEVNIKEYVIIDGKVLINQVPISFTPSKMLDLFNTETAKILREEGIIE